MVIFHSYVSLPEGKANNLPALKAGNFFGNDPSHHIRNVIIPATPSNPQQPIQQPYVKRSSKINHPQNHWLVVQ